VQRHQETLNTLQADVENHLHMVDLLSRWINWASAFVRLRQNVRNLLISLEETAPISGNLIRLNEIEMNVREQLAQQGLSSLHYISEAQQALDEMAQDYDRNLMEREKVFEREKLEFENLLSSVTGEKGHLRGKYQISKHAESYEDLYLEVRYSIQDALRSLRSRARVLELSIDNAEKQGLQKQAIAADRKQIKSLIHKVADGEENLLSPQESAASLGKRCKDTLQRISMVKEQLDDIDSRIPVQTMLPLTTVALLAKLTSHPQDVGEIIDLNAAIAALPTESELTALLKLCLEGRITLRVWVEDKAEII
jgi:hypothetical protein